MTKLVTYMKTDKESPFTLLLSDEDIDRDVDEFFRKVSEQAEKENEEKKIDRKIEDVEVIQRNLKALKEEGFIHGYEGDKDSIKEDSQ